MATFAKLLEERRIIRITVPLPRGKFPERKLYAYPECLEWARTNIPQMVTGRVASDFSPKEQITLRLQQWIAGDPMEYGRMFHDMDPNTDGVWEMKTADLRLFGWMYRPREFIAVGGGYADDYKEPTKTKDYADDRRVVIAARNALPLDGQKFVTGDFDELV
jgi:hypothetical protein